MNRSRWAEMSFIEKVRWRNQHPIKNSWYFVDKILAKDIAKKRAPECKVAKILQIPARSQDINTQSLPERYVFKANHGSSWLIKVKDGRNITTGEKITDSMLVEQSRRWLSKVCGWGKEKQYVLITPHVFFEEHLGNFLECRCFCFDGKIKFMMIDITHSGKIMSTIYDKDWNRIHAHWRDPEGPNMAKPKNLSKIIDTVEKLAADIDFVRVDVYLKGQDIYFGEFTFTPNGGSGHIHPPEFDKLWGSYWTHDMSKTTELKVPTGIKTTSLGTRLYTKAHINTHFLIRRARRVLNR